MPECLFTLHAYGTWMPDRLEGSYHWKRGYQPRNQRLAARYRAKQSQPAARFDASAQRVLIETVLEAAGFLQLRIHAVATDTVHVHIVCEWDDGRTAEHVQSRLKHALTQRLNERLERRSWFPRGGKPEPVEDADHFDYLCDEYLPEHRGRRWDARRGWC